MFASALLTLLVAGREAIVHEPTPVAGPGAAAAAPSALVIVLHGGLGNASRIAQKGAEHGLNLDDLADQHGFVVAYLNGTPVTKHLGARFLGWNAGGGCCGVPAGKQVDDVQYIANAVAELRARYGIGGDHVFALGHSNGAMMAQRVVCEAGVFEAIVAVSGPLNLAAADCPGARGRRVLAVHGVDDANVPIGGGVGTRGFSQVDFQSEAHARSLVMAAGGSYQLVPVPGADHSVEHLDAALIKSGALPVAGQAVQFFGL